MNKKPLILFLAVLISGCVVKQTDAATIFTDDFESGNLSKTTNGFKWLDQANTKIINYNGSNVLEFTYPSGGIESWSEQKFTLGNYYSEIWVKYDIYVSSNYVLRSNRNDKSYLYLWTDTYDAKKGVGAGFQNWGLNGNGDYLTFYDWSGGTDMPHTEDKVRGRQGAFGSHIGKWTNITIQMRSGTGQGDGIAKLWRDGKLVFEASKATAPSWYDINAFMYTQGLNNKFNNGYLLGYSNNGFDQTTKIYIDNIVFSTTDLIVTSLTAAKPPTPQTSIYRAGKETIPVRNNAMSYTGERVNTGDVCGGKVIKKTRSCSYMQVRPNEYACCTKWSK